jgi:hypothetical protein
MRSLKIVALLAAMNLCIWIPPQDALAQQGSVSFGVFYDELSPYGQWVDYPGYGNVWIPSTGSDFAPYSSNGYWIWTEYGWTWVSGYSWGWAPFHYGRWDYDNQYGWFWIPDNEWGPAWVSWRRSPGYYGWAPMQPGISLSVSFGSEYTVPHDRWRFVRDRDFSRTDINRYYINRSKNVTIINNSSVIKRTYIDQNRHSTYVSGPDRADVQTSTRRTIQPIVIHDNEKPGQNLRNGQLQIYRPQVQINDANGRRPAPANVVHLKDVKRPAERNAANPIPNVKPGDNNRKNVQPARPTNIAPTIDNKQKEQPAQPTNVTPKMNNRQRVQPAQPTNVAPKTNNRQRVQPAQPVNATPAMNNRQRVQPSPSVNPPNKVQPQPPRTVNPPKQNRTAQPLPPKTNRDENEKRNP